ncbi:MAG: DUF3999 family protein, partial [Polaromonas sp.]|nr:DUF3999 family protein [Polaromonas sp.]
MVINAPALSQQPSQQKMVLWAVLVVGVMVLGFMGWGLLRQA